MSLTTKKTLGIKDLVVDVRAVSGERQPSTVRILNKVSLEIQRGEILALVGESGCGKTVTARTILGLIEPSVFSIISGHIMLDEESLDVTDQKFMRPLRGKRVGYVVQAPFQSLDPSMKVGKQVEEVMYIHECCSGKDCRILATQILEHVGLSAKAVYNKYPHQLSGGMVQRVLIAMATACAPEYLIADEPTSALDVPIQKKILGLLKKLVREHHIGLLLISHDLNMLKGSADKVAVMYRGQIIEQGRADTLLNRPFHPYTTLLLQALPSYEKRGKPLATIPPAAATATGDTAGVISSSGKACIFSDRCPLAQTECFRNTPPFEEHDSGHWASCFYWSNAWKL